MASSGDDSGSNAAQEEELDLEMQSVTIDVQKMQCALLFFQSSRPLLCARITDPAHSPSSLQSPACPIAIHPVPSTLSLSLSHTQVVTAADVDVLVQARSKQQ